jgi:uncharacterized membrane protein
MDKIKQWMYYFIIGIVSMIALCFLPMIGSNVGLGWNLPNTVVGWIVWVTVKIIVAVLNVLIFHCFMLQAIINIKEHEKYQEAREILRLTEQKDFIPRSPSAWNKQQYGQKGVTIFITTALSTIALTQAMLTFDWMAMLTYLFTIIMGLIFGIMQMKTAEDYWTDEFWQYAQQVKRDMELAEKERAKQANDSSSDSSRSDILDTGVGSSDISDNSIGMVVDGIVSSNSVLGRTVYTSDCTAISTDNVCEENI